MIYKLIGAEKLGNIKYGGNIAAFFDFEGGVDYLHFAGPFGFEALYLYLGAWNELGVVLFGAGHVVKEICAVLILSVDGCLVLPPGLLGLNIGLHNDFGIEVGGYVFGVGHDAFALNVLVRGGNRLFGLSWFGIGSLLRLYVGIGSPIAVYVFIARIVVGAGDKRGRQGNDQQDSQKLLHFYSPLIFMVRSVKLMALSTN